MKGKTGRSMIKDQTYVVKVIDVGKVSNEIGIEALKEIEFM